MPYGMCVLDSYTYPYNPPKNQNPDVRLISLSNTLLGRVITDWGTDVSRRDITQTWDVMDAVFYAALRAKTMGTVPISFTDDDGTAYTVLPMPLTYDRTTPGGVAYMNVVLKMHIISSP